MIEKELLFFTENNGNEPVVKWLDSFNIKAQARLYKEISKLRVGLGDVKNLKGNLSELRIFFKDGSGYRVCFSEMENKIVLLLNPRYHNLVSVLNGLGLKLKVEHC